MLNKSIGKTGIEYVVNAGGTTYTSPLNLGSKEEPKKQLNIKTDKFIKNESPDPLLQRIRQLPKVDLHRHLEGSFRPEWILEIAQKYNIELPAKTVNELRPYVEITSADKTLLDFLKKFDTLALLFQNKDAIKELTYKVIEDANADNLRYLELRFAPHYMQSKSKLTADEIVDAVLDGIKDAKLDFPDIRVEPMLIAVRHLPPEKVKEIVDLDIKKGIGSIDLASDELNFPPELFCREFKEAKDKGLDITIHAGEARGADSVKSAISCGARRIGHGVRIIEDPIFMDEVKRLGIPLEICPTSNVQTGAVPALKDHPIRKFYDSGLNVTVNTDDPGVSGIDLSHEYLLLMKEFGFSMEDLEKIILNGVLAAFLPPNEKQELKKKFLAELESLKHVQGEYF